MILTSVKFAARAKRSVKITLFAPLLHNVLFFNMIKQLLPQISESLLKHLAQFFNGSISKEKPLSALKDVFLELLKADSTF